MSSAGNGKRSLATACPVESGISTYSTAQPWLGKQVTLENLKETMTKMDFAHMESLRPLFGIRFIVDHSGEMVEPDKFVMVIGKDLHKKLEKHIKDNPVPAYVQDILNSAPGA